MGYLPCLLSEPSSSCINLPRVSQWKVQSVINVNEGVTEEHGMVDLFQQLIDVSGVHNWGIVEHKVIQDLGLNWSGLYSVVYHCNLSYTESKYNATIMATCERT